MKHPVITEVDVTRFPEERITCMGLELAEHAEVWVSARTSEDRSEAVPTLCLDFRLDKIPEGARAEEDFRPLSGGVPWMELPPATITVAASMVGGANLTYDGYCEHVAGMLFTRDGRIEIALQPDWQVRFRLVVGRRAFELLRPLDEVRPYFRFAPGASAPPPP